jgi:TP901 family phage tail tape measure protein
VPRTAETIFLGDARPVELAARKAAAAVGESAGSMSASGAKMAAAQETAAKKTVAAHEKMVASAKKSNAEFAKWGSVAAVAVAAGAIDMASKVEQAGTAIAKAGNTSTVAGKKVEDAFRTIPGTVEYSAAKIGEAFATIAGELKVVEGHALTAAQAMKVMKAALDLADASGEKLIPATEALGKVMMTFHLGASQAAKTADVLFNASKVTGIGLTEFTTLVDRARGRLGALAPSLGDTAGLMAELAKQGVAGRLTMGALGGAFGTLLSQSKTVNATLKELNVHVFDNRGRFVGLTSVISQLHPVLGKYNEASQLAITRTLFGEKANKQLLEVIHQGPAAYAAATAAVTKHGTAAAAAAAQHKTLQGKLEATKADFENIAATLGERFIPILQKLATALDNSIKWLDKHRTAAKALAIVIGTVLGAAVLDFAVVKAVKFASSIGTMVGGLKLLAAKMGLTAGAVVAGDTAIEGANAAAAGSFTALAGTAVAAMAKIGLAVAAAVVVIKGLEGLLQKITGESQSVGELLGGNQPGEAGREGEAFRKLPQAQKEAAQRKITGGGGVGHGRAQAEYLEKLGLPAIVAAGLAGNFQNEGNATDTGASGLGIAQWMGPRRAAMEAFARATHRKPTDEGAQLEFAAKELRGSYGSVYAAAARAKTPQEAASILAKGYESPAPATAHYERRESSAAGAYGRQQFSAPSAAHKAAKRAAEAYANPFAHATGVSRSRTDQGVDFSFAGSLGAVGKGRIVNIVQDPGGFGTEIVEELTEGPHKGQFVYYGLETGATSLARKGEAVSAGQALARGKGSGGIELGFASGAGGVPVTPYGPGQSHGVPTAGGKAFSSFLASIGKGGSNLQLATAQFAEAAKAAAKLVLSAAQQAAVSRFGGAAESAHAAALRSGGTAGELEGNLSAAERGWARHPLNLATASGAALAAGRDVSSVGFAKAEKRYYQFEVAALKKEAGAWAKARDLYRRIARHTADPHAKKEALNAAAHYGAKVEQANAGIKELGGKIEGAEDAISSGEAAAAALPGEVQAADLGAYQAANAKVDLEARAGILTEAQAKAAKEANAQTALAGGFGALSEEGRLQVAGDLRELAKATTEATSALEAHTAALKEATKAVNEQLHASERIAQVENGALTKALADLISGQIGGIDYHGRVLTAGAGTAARY